MRPCMQRFAACLLAGLLAGRALAGSWESIESLPGHTAETVMVRDKPRVYFRLTPRAPLSLTIAGPAQLRMISRAVLAGPRSPETAYRIQAVESGRVLAAAAETVTAGKDSRAAGVAALGHGRRTVVELPPGTHRVTLSLTGVSAVLVRLQRSAPEGAETWVTLTPVKASRSVSVVEGQKTVAYFTAARGKPVVLRVVGPTTLDFTTRMDFDSTMRGVQTYRLRFVEGGRTIQESEFRTTKALNASYSNLGDRVPSKFDRLSMLVAAGVHEIEVQLVAPPTGAAEIHARIPQPSVGNAE